MTPQPHQLPLPLHRAIAYGSSWPSLPSAKSFRTGKLGETPQDLLSKRPLDGHSRHMQSPCPEGEDWIMGANSGQMRVALTGHARAVIASRTCGVAIQGRQHSPAGPGLPRRERSSH